MPEPRARIVARTPPVRLSNGIVALWDFKNKKAYLPQLVSSPGTTVQFPSVGPDGDPVAAPLVLRAVPPEGASAADVRWDWFVDGRPAGRGPTLVWNVPAFSPGIHEVRLVARVPQPSGVRLQGFARAEVEVAGDLLP